MKLDRRHGTPAHGADEGPTIIRLSQDPVRVGRLRHGAVGMDEIELLVLGARQQAPGAPRADAIPAHVRHRQARGLEAADLTGDDAQPRHPRRLIAALEQGLQANADTQEGPARPQVVAQGLEETHLVEPLDGGAIAADAREEDKVGLPDIPGGPDDLQLMAKLEHRVAHTADIARAVVE